TPRRPTGVAPVTDRGSPLPRGVPLVRRAHGESSFEARARIAARYAHPATILFRHAGDHIERSAEPNPPIPDPGQITSSVTFDEPYFVDRAQVEVDIDHRFPHHLVISLTSPAGTTTVFYDRVGGVDHGVKRTFDLPAFDSEKVAGTWTLSVRDAD